MTSVSACARPVAIIASAMRCQSVAVRGKTSFEETELLLHNEWATARKKGFADLKLPPLYQPTVPKISSAS